MASSEYPSRLSNRGAPLRGVGSAYAGNQAAAGVRNPEAAAAMAAKSDAERAAIEAAEERNEAHRHTLVSELLVAWQTGEWDPGSSGKRAKTESEREDFLERATTEDLIRWQRTMVKGREARIDRETDAAAASLLGDRFAPVSPDSPNYDPLMDSARRAKIEESAGPLDFESMIFQGYTDQKVQIHPKMSATFRTMMTQHGLWIEQVMAHKSGSEQHIRHTFSLYQVAASLVELNDRPWGTDISRMIEADQRKEFIEALEARMILLGKMPAQFTDDLIVNYIWFTGRVRKLLSGNLVEKVGNS